MSNDEKAAYVTRDTILKMLTDDEVGKVSTAETAPKLASGEEYLDLEHLELGVQRAGGTATPMGHVLPKNAVHANTWTKIVAQLTSARKA
jgi:hypothetical protein